MIAVAVTAYLLGILAACCVLWPALRAASKERDYWRAGRDRWRNAYYGECDRHDATLARLRQLDAEPPAATWDVQPPAVPAELCRIERAAKITLWLN